MAILKWRARKLPYLCERAMQRTGHTEVDVGCKTPRLGRKGARRQKGESLHVQYLSQGPPRATGHRVIVWYICDCWLSRGFNCGCTLPLAVGNLHRRMMIDRLLTYDGGTVCQGVLESQGCECTLPRFPSWPEAREAPACAGTVAQPTRPSGGNWKVYIGLDAAH